MGDKRHRRGVVVQALGHAGLTGKDQAAPSCAVSGVALADVCFEKLLIRRPVFEQDGYHLASVFERARVAGKDVFQIVFADSAGFHTGIGNDNHLRPGAGRQDRTARRRSWKRGLAFSWMTLLR